MNENMNTAAVETSAEASRKHLNKGMLTAIVALVMALIVSFTTMLEAFSMVRAYENKVVQLETRIDEINTQIIEIEKYLDDKLVLSFREFGK